MASFDPRLGAQMVLGGNTLVARLGWDEIAEHSWTELIEAGLPAQLAQLGCDHAQRTGRPLRLFTMPTMRVGIAGLALPFVDDDGIVFDRCVLDRPEELSDLVSHELAHVLYPSWSDRCTNGHEEMEEFARILGPCLLSRLPSQIDEVQPMIDTAMDRIRAE